MSGGNTYIFRLLAAALCTTALLAAHALRWPPSQDSFARLRKSVSEMEHLLPPDSAVSIRVVGLDDDHFNYLRYCLIPRPLELKFARTAQAVVLTSVASEQSAYARVYYERPDLRCIRRIRGTGYCLALFKPALHAYSAR